MIKYSKYNHLVKIPDENAYVLYNFRTGAFLKLDEFQKAVFDNAPDMPEHSKAVKTFLKGGFVVSYDELRHMRTEAFVAGGQSKVLGLSICPTLACNFSCPYCFEQARGGRMSRKIQDAVVDFARENLEKFELDCLSVQWFGGEPLLCPDIIENLSARLMEVCQSLDVDYYAKIFTNGWFLTKENAAILERAKVYSMQITLDGPTPETNDNLRRSRDGNSSFRRIMENLKNLRPFAAKLPEGLPLPPETVLPRIQIRCNVNKTNAHLYDELAKLVDDVAKDTGVTIFAYPAKMDSSEENRQDIRSSALAPEEYGRSIDAEAFAERMHSKYAKIYCMAQYQNSYVVDELGNLYKCNEAVGRDEYIIGNVQDFRLWQEPGEDIQVLDAFFETLFPEKDKECMECKMFPVCLGGCPKKRVDGQRECVPMKDNPDDFVLAKYRLRKR